MPTVDDYNDCLKPNNFNANGTYDDSTAEAAYKTATNSCATNYPDDPSSYGQCACQAGDQLDFTETSDENAYSYCHANVQNAEQNDCFTDLNARQRKDDNMALAVSINTTWSAYADYQKALILSAWSATLCYDQANVQYNNCDLSANCAVAPSTCCVANATITYNNACLNADTTYINKYSPAAADESFTLITCAYTQSHDNQVTYANETYLTDLANASYSFEYNDAANTYQNSLNQNYADCALAESLCECTNSTGQDCDTIPEAEMEATNAIALTNLQAANDGPSDTPVGFNWTAWNSACTNAAATAQDEYNTHYATQTNCTANAKSTYQSISDSAETEWDNSEYAATIAYQNALLACNGG